MEQPYVSRLRYVDADDVGNSPVDFGSLDVRDRDGLRLGQLDGFIIDADRARVLYTVVDSGGWFTSRRFLVPIGHAAISNDRSALALDLPKETVRNFPEFHEDRFRAFTDEDLRQFERHTVTVCCPDEPAGRLEAERTDYEAGRHYQAPAWWTSAGVAGDRLRPIETRPYRGPRADVSGDAVRTQDTFDRDLVRARADQPDDRPRERRTPDDTSPHLDGRAQPGDVLGVETGGERTYLGETGEDEDERRRAAERSASDERE